MSVLTPTGFRSCRLNAVSKSPRAWKPCADAGLQKQTSYPLVCFEYAKLSNPGGRRIYSVSECYGSEPENARLIELRNLL